MSVNVNTFIQSDTAQRDEKIRCKQFAIWQKLIENNGAKRDVGKQTTNRGVRCVFH